MAGFLEEGAPPRSVPVAAEECIPAASGHPLHGADGSGASHQRLCPHLLQENR